jgi:hypothetical protein
LLDLVPKHMILRVSPRQSKRVHEYVKKNYKGC